MSSLLWIVSFLLHMIALLAIYKLLQQVQHLKQQSISESNMDSKLKQYIEEIKQENRSLEAYMYKGRTNQKQQDDYIHEESEETKIVDPQTVQQDDQSKEDYWSEDAEDTVEASLDARVLQLYNQGKSIDEIASELKCGKTEAEIIIKLHQKNM
ncbi:hypothetical conserved protein [Oceanobacillus iheyensis HTE831]|uniref:Hypothetical conserved protein n=1 Tax=Oceanobacillus iheyensis (strain DSM 14371 / CIP 107618 / JCM 11309 / KCTC 3954 / HTE831) TaxID=221109 RepID=Q8EQV4_OCEIH|nr:hypothetical protein [Oceanobacillus iheyensis]BAC13541.1 hypothetical conserved protein [Oceanobacillus iheyensis HTE831]